MRYLPLFLLLASPSFASELNVYTYDSFVGEWGPGPILEKAFEAQCDCDLKFIPAGDGGAMLTRLTIEGDKSDADVALGLDQNLVPRAMETGLFADAGFKPVKLTGSDIKWDNSYFTPYDWGQFAFVYDRTKWAQSTDLGEPPLSLDALADGPTKVVIEDPRASTPGLGLALWVYEVYGEKSEDFWRRFKDNIVTVTPGWSEAYALFLSGEADAVLSYTTSPAYHRIVENDDSKVALKFTGGQGVQIELAGLLKSAKNPELANQFLAFLQSDAAQSAFTSANYMYPVTKIALPEGFDQPSEFQTLFQPADATNIDKALSAYQNGMN